MKYCSKNPHKFSRDQQGVALFVALIMLLILTIIGLSAANRSNLQEKMASNTHVQNMAFNAAESAIGGFMAEANFGDSDFIGDADNDPHLMVNIRNQRGLEEQCYNQNGARLACDGVFLDGDKASLIQAKVAVTVKGCDSCDGFSIGSDVKCRYFDVIGTGQVGGVTATHTLTVVELSACL